MSTDTLEFAPRPPDNGIVWGAPTVQEVAPQHGPLKGQKKWADGVPMIDTEHDQLQIALNACATNRDVRRPDGRRAPILLVAEAYWTAQRECVLLRKALESAAEREDRQLKTLLSISGEVAKLSGIVAGLQKPKTLIQHFWIWWRSR